MPDPKTLQIGDSIRILRVPENDLHQRANEIASGTEMVGWTADSIERIIAQTPVVQISQIDEYGCVAPLRLNFRRHSGNANSRNATSRQENDRQEN